jgi:hypothetical protein
VAIVSVQKKPLWPVAGVSRTTGSGGSPLNFSFTRQMLCHHSENKSFKHPKTDATLLSQKHAILKLGSETSFFWEFSIKTECLSSPKR